MIDVHCHIDMYLDPIKVANECEQAGIITIGMTNLPSHFEKGYPHVLSLKKVRLALGMHPLYAESHFKEFKCFEKNLSKTSYIGEIGLDFSKEGIATKDIQLESFRKILEKLNGQKKILSIHSRKAEKEVLRLLVENNIENAIFHWYSGSLPLIDEIVSKGYYFSVNTAMLQSKSGQEIIKRISINHLLTESDGPFISVDGRHAKPTDVKFVLSHLSELWNIDIEETTKLIEQNFKQLLAKLK